MSHAEQSDSGPAAATGSKTLVRSLLLASALLFALALGLWAQYGTAIFLATMANAWAYCF